MVFTSVSCDETYLRLPDYMRRADLDQVEPVVPLRRFIDVLTTLANDIDTTWNLFYYLPPDDNLPPQANNGTSIRSLLTTPSLADFKTVNWLAMVVGATLRDPSSGFTSWGSLLENADTDADGETTWGELVAEVDGDDANSTMDWFEIEGFAPSTVSFPYRQWQVESAAYGLRGGSVASIKAAVLQAFKESERSTKTITVSGDPADPFLILVNVAGMTEDDEGKVEDYVKPAIPAGFGLTVSAV
jgi:hypothetical protein